MIIPPLGKLRRNKTIREWLISKPIKIGLFPDTRLTFTLEDIETDDSPDDFVMALRHFLALNVKDRDKASKYVFKVYRDFRKLIGAGRIPCEVDDADIIWQHVHPTGVHVSRRLEDKLVYVQLLAECDWEIEHGVQLVYRRGKKLSRVSDQDGHLTHSDALDLPESRDKIC